MHNGLWAALLALILFLAIPPAQATTGDSYVAHAGWTSLTPVANYEQSDIGFNRAVHGLRVSQNAIRPIAADLELRGEDVSAAAVLASTPRPGGMMLTGSALIALGLALKKARKKA